MIEGTKSLIVDQLDDGGGGDDDDVYGLTGDCLLLIIRKKESLYLSNYSE